MNIPHYILNVDDVVSVHNYFRTDISIELGSLIAGVLKNQIKSDINLERIMVDRMTNTYNIRPKINV